MLGIFDWIASEVPEGLSPVKNDTPFCSTSFFAASMAEAGFPSWF